MAKPRKYTRYQYRRDPHTAEMDLQGGKAPIFKPDETTAEWLARLRTAGFTEEMLNAIQAITSLEGFVDFCKAQNVAEADIAGKRLLTNMLEDGARN